MDNLVVADDNALPVPAARPKSKVFTGGALSSSLLDELGMPRAHESNLLTNPLTCALYTMVLIGLCVANSYYFGSGSPELSLYLWWQKIKLLYDIGVSGPAQQAQLAFCALTAGYILVRWFRMAMVYGRHTSVWVALLPFFVLSFIPFTELLNSTVTSVAACGDSIGALINTEQLGRSAGFFSRMSKFSESLTPAFALCWGAGILMFMKVTWNPAKALRVFDDGMIVSLKKTAGLIGERSLPWLDIENVEMIKLGDEKKSREPLVRFHLKSGPPVEFTWKELSAAGDPADLFAALKTAVPAAVPHNLLGAERAADQGDSYTELWLKYFTTGSKRERTGRLEDGAILGEGKYIIAGEIGAGGQGTAYLATPAGTIAGHDSVVLKEYIMPLHRGEALFQQSMKKLEHESQILQRIDHPHIVKMLDHFVEDHRGYLVLEYVDGKPLKQIVQLQGKQSEAHVVQLAVQICDILAYLHKLEPPVVHRDLTPDNLILQEDGTVKLVDFNVAQQLESAATATVVGKHAFIPPEQFRGKPSPQSDIYAFGGTLFHLLTGGDPEPLSSSRPRSVVPTVSEELDRIIACSTALDCNKRYANIGKMKEDLEALQQKCS